MSNFKAVSVDRFFSKEALTNSCIQSDALGQAHYTASWLILIFKRVFFRQMRRSQANEDVDEKAFDAFYTEGFKHL